MEDHHVDRPEVEAEQSAQPTGTNRSNPPDPNPLPGALGKDGKPPACSGKRPSRDAPAAARQTLPRHLHKSRPVGPRIKSGGSIRPDRAPLRAGSHGGLASLVATARGQTPDPIPNSAVKTLSADGTVP